MPRKTTSTTPQPQMFDESTAATGQGQYQVERCYRPGTHTLRIDLKRGEYPDQSHAHAYVLTPALEWTRLCGNDPANWYEGSPLYGDKVFGKGHTETGITLLRRMADQLATRAATILTPTSP